MRDGRRSFTALLLAGTAASFAAAPPAPPASPASAAHAIVIVIENMQFTPASARVRGGERILWVNRDLVPHTVTARDGSFDSGIIEAGAQWSTAAAAAGRVAYGCTLHPSMTAALVVE